MKIGSDLIWQIQGETLGSVIEQTRQCQVHDQPTTRVSLVHAVNFFLRDGELPVDQLETLRAIQRAQWPTNCDVRLLVLADSADVEQLTTLVEPFASDITIADAKFTGAMPLLTELLDTVDVDVDSNEHVIFTNADICPVPGFYDAVASIIGAGAESAVINRRSTFGFWPGDPDAALAAHALGAAHPGFDCFVFSADALSELVPAQSTIGSPYVMLPLLLNLVAVSSPLVVLTDAHLTYHFGDDRSWSNDGRSAVAAANLVAAQHVIDGHETSGTSRIERFLTAFPNWDPSSITTS